MWRLVHSKDARLMVGLRREDLTPEGFSQCRSCPAVASFAGLLAPEVELVAVVAPALEADFQASIECLRAELAADAEAFILLLARKPPPKKWTRGDGAVDSFLAGRSLMQKVLDTGLEPGAIPVEELPLETLCFRVLASIANGEASAGRLLARQLPYDAEGQIPVTAPGIRAAVLMPHRGDFGHLATALHYVGKTTGMPLAVRVGLDVDNPRPYVPLAAMSEFYTARPAPCGPYVIRQELANRSLEPALVWQDSDDIPCSDRFVTLWRELQSTGCDIVGCHELRFDEISGRVEAWRYPLETSAVLAETGADAFLPATAMVRRSAFHRAGGFSTHQRIGNDSQFILRASFTASIRNADAFVYIRRRHGQSLTESKETGTHAPLRRQLAKTWYPDYRAVRAGAMTLDRSSLRPIAGTRSYRFEPFPARDPVVRMPLRRRAWRRFASLFRKAPIPVASLIVPVRSQNGEWLEQCLRSALGQTAPVEVIVVIAEATPASNLALIERLAARSPAVVAIRGEKPESFASAVNTGICEVSTGRIGILSSGDWIEPDTVARCLREPADVVSTGGGRGSSLTDFQSCVTLCAKAALLKPFLLVRREKLLQAGGVDETIGNNPGASIYDLVWSLLENGAGVAIVEEALYHMRHRGGERPADAQEFARIFRKHGMAEEEAQEFVRDRVAW